MSALVTNIMYEMLPFLTSRNITLTQGFMMVDVQICRLTLENPPNNNDLQVVVDAFRFLNKTLINFIPLLDSEVKLFDVEDDCSKLNVLLTKPDFLFKSSSGPGFLQKRIDVYAKYFPEVLELLDSLVETKAAAA